MAILKPAQFVFPTSAKLKWRLNLFPEPAADSWPDRTKANKLPSHPASVLARRLRPAIPRQFPKLGKKLFTPPWIYRLFTGRIREQLNLF